MPVFPPAAAIPLTSDAAVTNDVLELLDTPTTDPAPLDRLMTGMLAMLLATVTTVPDAAEALFVMVTAPLEPFITVAATLFAMELAAAAFLAALITAA